MPTALLNVLLALPVFALVTCRVSGLFMTAPIFASRVIPRRIKAAFILAWSTLMFPMMAARAPQDVTLAQALTGVVGELLIGMILGLLLTVAATGMQIAGLMAGQQAGLALANVFDPTMDEQTTPIEQIYTIVFFTAFLMIGGHRDATRALLDSFEVIPPLAFEFNASILGILVDTLTAALIMGVRLAGPVLIALFLVSLATGFLSRTMPQLNILTVGFNLRACTLLLVAGASLTFVEDLVVDLLIGALDAAKAGLRLPPG